jgi:hypothetical protein
MFEMNLGLAYLHLGLCVTLRGFFFGAYEARYMEARSWKNWMQKNII